MIEPTEATAREPAEVAEDGGLEPSAPSPQRTTAPGSGRADSLPDRPKVQPVSAASGNEVSLLRDLPLPVSVELGRTRLPVQEILSLGRGSVVQLERLAGEPVDLFVGDRRFAEGEVVVMGEQFGVRITRILGSDAPGNGAAG